MSSSAGGGRHDVPTHSRHDSQPGAGLVDRPGHGLLLVLLFALLTSCGASSQRAHAQPLEGQEAHAQTGEVTRASIREFDSFGIAVDFDGENGIVGALGSQALGEGAAAYIFAGQDPLQAALLPPPDIEPRSLYGTAVAIEGDTAFVGAPFESGNGERSGAVHLYEQLDGEWTYSGTITASRAEPYAYFGEALAVSGETLAVAAPGFGDEAVYLFERQGDGWQEVARLERPASLGNGNGSEGPIFGSSVALYDEWLAVGAATASSSSTGSVFVYRREEGDWALFEELESNLGGDLYGEAVALGEGLLAVAAPGTVQPGRVIAYRLSEDTWRVAGTLEPDHGGARGFGVTVAIDGQQIIVSAPTESDGNGTPGVGAVYVFTIGTGDSGPRLLTSLQPPESEADMEFGAAIAAADGRLLIGAPGAAGSGQENRAGRAFLLDLTGSVEQ